MCTRPKLAVLILQPQVELQLDDKAVCLRKSCVMDISFICAKEKMQSNICDANIKEL